MPETKEKIPPRDSWVTLAPGATVHIDERLGREWTRRTQECRGIRGNVLAKCFEIEYILDQVIAEVMIPTTEENADRRDMLDEFFLKGPPATFRNKIEVLRKLHSRVSRLQGLLPGDAFQRLTAVRELRNDFAHYPVTFEPVGEPPNQTLRPLLVSRRGRFVLDEVFLEEQSKIVGSIFADLEAAFKALMPSTGEGVQQADGADDRSPG